MEEKTNRNGLIIRKSLLPDVPVELIHHIQSLLPVEEAARTCILSKSWLHAWSTHPTLRFPSLHLQEKTTEFYKFIDATLLRYHHHNIPIQKFCLEFAIADKRLASLAENWIRLVTSKACLKKLSLAIRVGHDESFTLPDEIFSNKNLNIIEVKNLDKIDPNHPMLSLSISGNPTLINCVSLRMLHLFAVNITDKVLDNLLSTCILLEAIYLCCCDNIKTIKVKNLPYLQQLKIITKDECILEIDHVPSLRVFNYRSVWDWNKPLPFNMDSLGSVTELLICGVIMDETFFGMIKSKLPLLESLTLEISYRIESLVITSASLKRLTLFLLGDWPIHVHVHAPKLLHCRYDNDIRRVSVGPDSIRNQVELTPLYFHWKLGSSLG